jgi:hypothetical protein
MFIVFLFWSLFLLSVITFLLLVITFQYYHCLLLLILGFHYSSSPCVTFALLLHIISLGSDTTPTYHLVATCFTSPFCGDSIPPCFQCLGCNNNNLCMWKGWVFFPMGLFVGICFFFSCMVLFLLARVCLYGCLGFGFWINQGLLSFCCDLFM